MSNKSKDELTIDTLRVIRHNLEGIYNELDKIKEAADRIEERIEESDDTLGVQECTQFLDEYCKASDEDVMYYWGPSSQPGYNVYAAVYVVTEYGSYTKTKSPTGGHIVSCRPTNIKFNARGDTEQEALNNIVGMVKDEQRHKES